MLELSPHRVIDVSISPAFPEDGMAFCATDQGLEMTRNHGATWNPVAFGPGGPVPITAVAVSPNFATDGTVVMTIPGGVGRSEDGGATWAFTQLPSPPPIATCIAFAPDVRAGATLFLGTLEDGVWRSEDGGRSWNAWNSGLVDLSITSLTLSPSFENDGVVLAGTESGLYISHNRGRRWERTRLSVGDTTIGSLAMIQRADTTSVLAAIEGEGLWHSGNLGKTWMPVDPDLELLLMTVAPGMEQVLVLTESSLHTYQLDAEGLPSATGSTPAMGDEIVAIAAIRREEQSWDIVLADTNGQLTALNGTYS